MGEKQNQSFQLSFETLLQTDFQGSRVKAQDLAGHAIYYHVPSFFKHFSTSQINELIAPRPRLSLNGRKDKLTPPAGSEHVRDGLLPLYAKYGKSADCHIELFDCAHEVLPQTWQLALDRMDEQLVQG